MKSITIDALYKEKIFSAKGIPQFRFMNSGKTYSRLEDSKRVTVYDLKSGKLLKTLFDIGKCKEIGAEKLHSYAFSKDETKLLLAVDFEKIYRRTFYASYFVYDLKKKTVTPVCDKKRQKLASFSPDGKKVAFVLANDLYVKDLASGKEIRLTKDGKATKVINGAPDWVYEEEWYMTYGYQWSPDSQSIAYLRFDESKVKEYRIDFYHGTDYPKPFVYKYPRAGEDNSKVTCHVFDLKTKKTVTLDTGSDDIYIPTIQWEPKGKYLYLLIVNRLQNHFEWLRARKGQTELECVYEEANERYCDIDQQLYFLKESPEFLLRTSRSGRWHVMRCKLDGAYICHLTNGEWDVSAVKAIDEKKKLVYLETTKTNHLQRQLFKVGFNGEQLERVTKGQGTHNITFNSDASLFIDCHSTNQAPPVYTLHTSDGKALRVLESNAALKKLLKDYPVTKKEMFHFVTPEKTKLFGWIIKPYKFDPKKRYPLFMTFYNGPHSQAATEGWQFGWERYLAERGYIVACVDGRGTGWRGEEFLKCTYKQLGRYEVEDQIYAAKFLGSLPYVDEKRIGVFGWSYGGFMASSLMVRGGNVFKLGIAVASVTDWRFYDTIYTEKFMSTPQENPDYGKWSPVNFVDGLTGKLLLVHGIADDNVHFQNSLLLEEALIKAGKQFEMHYVLNKDHGIGGVHTTPHLYTRMLNFITENL